MAQILDVTDALRTVLLHYSRGYEWSVTWDFPTEKLEALDEKLTDDYGVRLPPYERQRRRRGGLPCALVVYSRVYGKNGQGRVFLLSQPFEKRLLHKNSPFMREKWREMPPEYGDLFKIAQEPSAAKGGKMAWTWQLQPKKRSILQNELLKVVKSGDVETVRMMGNSMEKLPMFGGIRRQIRRILRESQKLWIATKPQPWPGPDPENLPKAGGFKRSKV